MKYRVFAEAQFDLNFIENYLRHLFGDNYNNLDISYRSVDGYTNLAKSQPLFQEISDQEGKNILVFDADFVATGGGLQNRTNYLEEQKQQLSIAFESFLFPDNQNEGEIENLLEAIIVENHRNIIECFHGYENCIRELDKANNQEHYYTPNKKAKIYAYVESLTPPADFEKAIKAKNFFFTDANYWDLNSNSLQQFRNFCVEQIIL